MMRRSSRTTPMPKLAIVAADFNRSIVDPMIEGARLEAEARGYTVSVFRLPGAYELPLPVARLLEQADVETVVALGYIERGHTQHGEVMGHVVHEALTRLSLQYQKPVGLGIIGPGATLEQAEERKASYGPAAVRAALAALETLRAVGAGPK